MDIKALNRFALVQTKFTPDIATLELSLLQRVFVCDDLMLAGKNHKLIRDHSTRICRVFTRRSYNFYQKRTDQTPVVLPAIQVNSRYDFSSLKIKGEVYSVESSAIPKLDTHYQNGVQYKRVRAQLLYPTSQHGQVVNRDERGKPLPPALQGYKHFLLPERVDPIEAWMYIGIPEYWKDLIDGGYFFEPARIAEPKKERPWLLKYYHFQNRP